MYLESSGVLTPLKTFVKNMLIHVHKVIHLVVGTFEARVKKIEVKRSWSRWSQSDRTLVSEEPARPVSCNSEDAGIGQMTRR